MNHLYRYAKKHNLVYIKKGKCVIIKDTDGNLAVEVNHKTQTISLFDDYANYADYFKRLFPGYILYIKRNTDNA